ncbi:transcriptional corepressor LEUNIG_HOMOLOG-like [Cannabis sativa]|uniref:transcriptional corepressor LEUNIG_HOMOLOG-like n=1 Tax=Cannabis sativa TaxID=3483 RepID=UPI0029CAA518|nr:transcriptional corepressor LEUNIG_HOMOLOG-like [Cannabis sativa]
MANDFDSDPKKQFDIYIHDYLVKKNLPHVAEIFRKEAKMSDHSIRIDTSKVFLLDWWRSFYEYFGPNLEGIRQIFVWDVGTSCSYSTLTGHLSLITDIQFQQNSSIFASSSFDGTIKIWDAASPNQLLSNLFVGHSKAVHSLDFKSNNTLFSCDNTNQITQWDLTQSTSYVSNVMRTASHIRIQPNHGKLLAFASGNEVGFFNTETREVLFTGKVHEKIVCLVCWDYDGDHIVSVSEDRVQVWSLSKGQCMYQLDSNGDHYQSCTIHPFYRHTWIIGGNKNLKLWNQKAGPKVLKVVAHGGDVTALAESLETNMIASASDDQCVKLWQEKDINY